jgi:hypothetical protein
MLFIGENEDFIRSAGFAFEPIGDREILLCEIPAVYGNLNPGRLSV